MTEKSIVTEAYIAHLEARNAELLEALQIIVENADVPHPLSGREPTVQMAHLKWAAAAIAKARGKQEATQAESPGRSGEEG